MSTQNKNIFKIGLILVIFVIYFGILGWLIFGSIKNNTTIPKYNKITLNKPVVKRFDDSSTVLINAGNSILIPSTSTVSGIEIQGLFSNQQVFDQKFSTNDLSDYAINQLVDQFKAAIKNDQLVFWYKLISLTNLIKCPLAVKPKLTNRFKPLKIIKSNTLKSRFMKAIRSYLS